LAQEAPLVYSSAEFGFRIERPSKDWVLQEKPSSGSDSFQLVLSLGSEEGRVQVTVRVAPVPAQQGPVDYRDDLIRKVTGQAGYSQPRKTKRRIAGREVPGLSVDMNSATGDPYHVVQYYLDANGFRYVLQTHAPPDRFVDFAAAFGKAIDGFGVIPLSEEAQAGRKLRALAARCGSEIGWASSWQEAAQRAEKEKKLVLVVIRAFPGFQISDEVSAGPFMDPDVVELVRARYVALRLLPGMPAPFRSPEAYGLSKTTFGASILLVRPDGHVAGEAPNMNPTAVYDTLLGALAEHAPANGTGLDAAADALRQGELERAAQLLARPDSLRGHLLKADLHRRQRNGPAALEELSKAREAGGGDPDGRIEAREARILLRMGSFDQGMNKLAGFQEEHPQSPQIPEALYWLGAVQLRLHNPGEASATWKELVRSHGESRWAWKAAAALESTAFSLGYGKRLDWPPANLLESVRIPPREPWRVARARRAERDALHFILTRQRPDGSWISPSEVNASSDKGPDDFTRAITAICGRSLLAHREASGAGEAVRLAVSYLLESRRKLEQEPEPVFFMDYSVWSKAATLLFFADCLDAGIGDAAVLRSVMEKLVPEIQARQKSGGGWSYYVTGDLETGGSPANQSISFITAAALLSLVRAEEAGVEVPAELKAKAAGCLERMRNSNGTFEYMLFHDQEGVARNTGRSGAAGRGPVCSLALYRAGHGNLDEIRACLRIFVEHRGEFRREQRKGLMHAGPDGQGSHYLMFDYALAAEAIGELPKAERPAFQEPVLEEILHARTLEGSYLDNPLLGRDYGTGMALLAFPRLIQG
ncbi:MAG: hypothetical protein ACE5H3_04315, partial [Planctomycetota bacterium]